MNNQERDIESQLKKGHTKQELYDYIYQLDYIQPSFQLMMAKHATEKLIQSGIPFDGVFATNDWRAYGVLVALTENHIRVPEDVKMIGFDDIPISYACQPPLSTIHQNTKQLAQKASGLLLSLMNGETIDGDEKHYILPVELIQRDSTRL